VAYRQNQEHSRLKSFPISKNLTNWWLERRRACVKAIPKDIPSKQQHLWRFSTSPIRNIPRSFGTAKEAATFVTTQASSSSFVIKFQSYRAKLLNSMRTWLSDTSTLVMALQTLGSEHVTKRSNRHESQQARVPQSSTETAVFAEWGRVFKWNKIVQPGCWDCSASERVYSQQLLFSVYDKYALLTMFRARDRYLNKVPRVSRCNAHIHLALTLTGFDESKQHIEVTQALIVRHHVRVHRLRYRTS
jgi:hypothetical protein